jgi:enamine deaminase RidA (YjgF/YER057c/UK114 family)
MPAKKITSPHVPEVPGGIYSNCLMVGDQIFLSGMTASRAETKLSLEVDGNTEGGDDPKAQVRAVLTKIKNLLDAAGSNMGDIVKMTYYVTDLKKVHPAIQEVRSEFISGSVMPCSTLVEVKGLRNPEWVVELDVVAVKGANRPGQRL